MSSTLTRAAIDGLTFGRPSRLASRDDLDDVDYPIDQALEWLIQDAEDRRFLQSASAAAEVVAEDFGALLHGFDQCSSWEPVLRGSLAQRGYRRYVDGRDVVFEVVGNGLSSRLEGAAPNSDAISWSCSEAAAQLRYNGDRKALATALLAAIQGEHFDLWIGKLPPATLAVLGVVALGRDGDGDGGEAAAALAQPTPDSTAVLRTASPELADRGVELPALERLPAWFRASFVWAASKEAATPVRDAGAVAPRAGGPGTQPGPTADAARGLVDEPVDVTPTVTEEVFNEHHPELMREDIAASVVDEMPMDGPAARSEDREHEPEFRPATPAESDRADRQDRFSVRQERAGAREQPALLGLTDFLATADEPASYRIDGLWPVGGRIVLAAQYKAGKSTLRDNLVRSLADGVPFLGRFDITPFAGSIVLIDDELDERMLRRWLREQGIGHTDRVHVLPLRGRVADFDLTVPTIRRRWAQELSSVKPGIVVLDCLRPVLDAAGLSEDKDAGRFLVGFDALLTECGASEGMVIHHMGHGRNRPRGDARLRDWPDVEWQILREGATGEQEATARRYFKAYGRDVEVPEGLLNFESEGRRLTLAAGSRRPAGAQDLIPNILIYLKQHPGATQNGIEQAMHEFPRSDLRGAIKHAVAKGQIRVEAGPRRAKLHFLIDLDSQEATTAPTTPALRQTEQDDCATAP